MTTQLLTVKEVSKRNHEIPYEPVDSAQMILQSLELYTGEAPFIAHYEEYCILNDSTYVQIVTRYLEDEGWVVMQDEDHGFPCLKIIGNELRERELLEERYQKVIKKINPLLESLRAGDFFELPLSRLPIMYFDQPLMDLLLADLKDKGWQVTLRTVLAHSRTEDSVDGIRITKPPL